MALIYNCKVQRAHPALKLTYSPKIEAIKEYRARTGLDLKTCKEAIERLGGI